MKLKYEFVVREVGTSKVAVAVGTGNANFNGMVKLNDTGAVIFEMLRSDTTTEEIIASVVKRYEITEEEASAAVVPYIETLRKNGLIVD